MIKDTNFKYLSSNMEYQWNYPVLKSAFHYNFCKCSSNHTMTTVHHRSVVALKMSPVPIVKPHARMERLAVRLLTGRCTDAVPSLMVCAVRPITAAALTTTSVAIANTVSFTRMAMLSRSCLVLTYYLRRNLKDKHFDTIICNPLFKY